MPRGLIKSIISLKTFFITAIVIFLFHISSSAQSIVIEGKVIPETSIENYRMGMKSNNNGVIMSCIYFAGKYRIHEFNEDILDVIQHSDNIGICQMAIWSLYQIGDEDCCEKVNQYFSMHESVELRNCCAFCKKIKDYDTGITKTIKMAGR